MQQAFKLIKQTRANFEMLVRDLPVAKLNKIPQGFSNNILWNFGHVIVTQQLLTYGRCGLDFRVNTDIIERFRKGTKPEENGDQCDLAELLHISANSLKAFEEDYFNGLFENYDAYETSYGIRLNHIEDAIHFIPVHEGLHLGVSKAMKKII